MKTYFNLPVSGRAFDKQMTPVELRSPAAKTRVSEEKKKKIKSLHQTSPSIHSQENKSSDVTAGLWVLSVLLHSRTHSSLRPLHNKIPL